MLRVRWTLGLILAGLLLGTWSGCSSGDHTQLVLPLTSGSLRIALVTQTAQATYRLEAAVFDLNGPLQRTFSPPDDAASLTEDVPVGDYSLALRDGWTLTRLEGDGALPIAGARLVSVNPVTFSVQEQQLTQLRFVFDVSGQIITIGAGRFEVDLAVVGDETAPPACPPGFVDVDGNPATGTGGCECQITDPDDPFDSDLTDENCDGTDGVAASCVFVSHSRGHDDAAGTPDSPLASVAAGLRRALESGRSSLCLSGETYDEAVTLVDGVSLYGGFDAADPELPFRRSAQAVTRVRAPGTAVSASNLSQPTQLQRLSIIAQTPLVGDDPSTYGVRVANTELQLIAVDVLAERGRDGAAGVSGAAQPPAPSGLNGQLGCSACSGAVAALGGSAPLCPLPGTRGGNGGLGGPGEPSGGATGGFQGPTCTAPAGAGSAGRDGFAGTTGVSGFAGADVGQLAERYVPASGTAGSLGTASTPGGGGGGGGSATAGFLLCTLAGGSGGGSGGCAGLAGQPGSGGGGGGGSFAIFATGSAIVVLGSVDLSTHGGGNGGPGGDGGPGQLGGNGGFGGAAAGPAGAGGNGGHGGNGAAGGHGGSGGGGPSACIARQASVQVTAAASCSVGLGGLGGVSPGSVGPAGAAAREIVR